MMSREQKEVDAISRFGQTMQRLVGCGKKYGFCSECNKTLLKI